MSAPAAKKQPKKNGSARPRIVTPRPDAPCPGLEGCGAVQLVRDREVVAAKAAADASIAAVKALLDARLSESDAKLETALLGIGRLQSEMSIVQREQLRVSELIRQTLDQQQGRIDHLEAKLIDEAEQDRQSRADVLAEVRLLRREVTGGNGHAAA